MCGARLLALVEVGTEVEGKRDWGSIPNAIVFIEDSYK